MPPTTGASRRWWPLWQRRWLIPSLVGVLAGALYVREANPAAGGGNSGEFQVMAHLLGIAHPPSYPLYLLLAKGASLLPLPGDVAWRMNALTGVLAGVAVCFAGLLPLALWPPLCRRHATSDQRQGDCSPVRLRARQDRLPLRGGDGERPLPAAAIEGTDVAAADSRWWRIRLGGAAVLLAAAVAAVATAAMPRLWTLAVEAEVFTLHLALVLAFWLVLLMWQSAGGRIADRWLLAAGLLAGLGLANHSTFLFTAAAGALFVLLTRPRTLFRFRLLAGCVALVALGLTPYLYVVRGLVVPVAYFAPTDVHRLTRGEVWYVLQGNLAGETGGGEIVRRLFADQGLFDVRTLWLRRHLAAQFGPAGEWLALAGGAGLVVLLFARLRWTATALLGAAGAAVFAMAYAKYPDGDRYLLPLETLLALGIATLVAAVAAGLERLLRRTATLAQIVGVAIGATLSVYWGLSLGALAGATDFTRGAYVHHTLHNLNGVEPRAVVCSWWASSWGWWYAQYVDGHRPDVTVVSKGPDACVRDVLPEEFGRRPVYVPAVSDGVRSAPYVFFPSRDLWLAVAPRAPLAEGTVLKGPDDRLYLYESGRRRWVPSLDAFSRAGLTWELVRLTPDYVLREIPEGPPLVE